MLRASTDNITGIRLREARKERGKTQTDVANVVHSKKATVCRWESGDIATMKWQVLTAIAEYLGVTPQWLAGLDYPKYEIQPGTKSELEQLVSTLDEKQSQKVIRFIKEFIL